VNIGKNPHLLQFHTVHIPIELATSVAPWTKESNIAVATFYSNTPYNVSFRQEFSELQKYIFQKWNIVKTNSPAMHKPKMTSLLKLVKMFFSLPQWKFIAGNLPVICRQFTGKLPESGFFTGR
jgi:hypothetical protein